ncbi:unnamed protein product [Dibothriocephalus latus]|uniref:Calponin-homology (CH) domain-containing protein n=1 Tax=Dibothriocephalus latus TaxID=60516 RepID=A0A3P7Q9B0_DIBLA|nr:unnamed protein product [Dibothriocephalus latus]
MLWKSGPACSVELVLFFNENFMILFLFILEEQERVQKKTFTNWINAYLVKAVPSDFIRDLFVEIRDGVKLLRLLERIEKPHIMQRAHHLSNVKTALDFLTEDRKLKLVNINPADVVDGKPAIVLGLIWSIILSFQVFWTFLASKTPNPSFFPYVCLIWNCTFFAQIDEHNGALQGLPIADTSDDSAKDKSGSTSSPASEQKNTAPQTTSHKALLMWIRRCIDSDDRPLPVQVNDFGPSWRDGKAFCALVHSIDPKSLDPSSVQDGANKQNLEVAFTAAEEKLGIPRLLDVEGKLIRPCFSWYLSPSYYSNPHTVTMGLFYH